MNAARQISFPNGMHCDVAFDVTTFVNESIKEVVITLLLSIVLVVLVIYRLPAESAFDADSGGDDSGLADRHVLRDADLRLHDQHDHALRADARDGTRSSTTRSS